MDDPYVDLLDLLEWLGRNHPELLYAVRPIAVTAGIVSDTAIITTGYIVDTTPGDA